MLILNATNEPQSVKAFGNWFSFKPKQTKLVSDDIGRFLIEERAANGLVELPAEFQDPSHKNSPEGKAQFEAAEQRGIDSYIKALRGLIYNNQVSMRQDLEKSNIKVDPAIYASDAELQAMRLVAKYQRDAEDTEAKKIEEIKDLMKKVGK